MSVDKVQPLPPSGFDPAGTKSGGSTRAIVGARIVAPQSVFAGSPPAQGSRAIPLDQPIPTDIEALSTSALLALSLEAETGARNGLGNAGDAVVSAAYGAAAPAASGEDALGRLPPAPLLGRAMLTALEERTSALQADH